MVHQVCIRRVLETYMDMCITNMEQSIQTVAAKHIFECAVSAQTSKTHTDTHMQL